MKTKDFRNDTDVLRTESFFEKEAASFNGFADFCKLNMPLVISVTLACLFVYGVILFNISIIGDTTRCLADPVFTKTDLFSLGRWGIVLLSNLFFITETGIYAANFIAVVAIWIFSMLFCYFIAVFTKITTRRNGFIPLALIVLTYSVWSQYFLTFYVNKIQPIFICITLINVYLLYNSLLSRNKINILISFMITILSFGVHQSLVTLFLCFVFIFFVLLQENSNLPAKEYSMLCLKLFCFFVAAFILRLIIDRIVQSVLGIPKNTYVNGAMVWNKLNIRSIIINVFGQIYLMTIGLIPFIHSLFSPIMANMYGGDVGPYGNAITENVFQYARTIGNVFLLPAVIMFLVMIFINANKRIQKDRRLLYVLAGIAIPFSTLFTVIALGEVRGIRTLYCLPFAAAFMFYYVAIRQKAVLRRVFYCLILATAFYQGQVTQSMLEGAVRISELDTNIAFDIDARLRDHLAVDEKPIVAFVGNKHPFSNQIFPMLDVVARSPFERWSLADMSYQTNEIIYFMKVLGFHYDVPSLEQMQEAYEASRSMPAYPAAGAVKNLGNVVVVKMGD